MIRTRRNGPSTSSDDIAPVVIVCGVKSASAVAPSVPYSTVTTVVPPATASHDSSFVKPVVSNHGDSSGEFATVSGVSVSHTR